MAISKADSSGWTVTAGGSTTSTALTPWLSTAEFKSGTASNAVAQQTINLVAAGYTSTQLDSGSLQVAFGGEVAVLSGAVKRADFSPVLRWQRQYDR